MAGCPEGLQDYGGPQEGHPEERSLLPPGRERAVRHLRRHVPRHSPRWGGHHPTGGRGGQLLHHRCWGSRCEWLGSCTGDHE